MRSVAAFVVVLLAVLLVLTHVGEGLYGPPVLYGSPVPVLQGQTPDTGATYYDNAYTLVDLTPQELMKALPELQGVDLAAGEPDLLRVLYNTGKSVADSYQNLTDIVASERITQELYSANQRHTSTFQQEFSYLILIHRDELGEHLEEYRTGAQASEAGSVIGPVKGFMFTSGFAGMWLLFYPPNQSGSKFRYLGEQSLEGHKAYVVCFAERPGEAVITGSVNLGLKSALLLYQGVVWIDAVSYRVMRMRLDLLQPRLDVALEKLTTEIHFGEVTIPHADSSLWLPLQVTVTTMDNGQMFRNRHVYSNYRLFSVKSSIKPAT